jgi:hypothetical protein
MIPKFVHGPCIISERKLNAGDGLGQSIAIEKIMFDQQIIQCEHEEFWSEAVPNLSRAGSDTSVDADDSYDYPILYVAIVHAWPSFVAPEESDAESCVSMPPLSSPHCDYDSSNE